MARPLDKVRVEVLPRGLGVAAGSLDHFTSLDITADLESPSEASFELGDDGTYESLRAYITPGTQYRVFVNGHPVLTGRVEANDLPLDSSAGAVARFSVRTKLSDAMYSTARQSTKVQNVSIKEFIEELYAPLGITSGDFEYRASAARDLITGKSSGNRGSDTPVDLNPIKVQEARVRPPETVYAAADRHLRRHGLMHWDGPDGKIIIGAPNDTQDPQYVFNAWRDPNRRALNNVLAISKIRDISGMPTAVGVFGVGGKRSFTKSRVAAFAQNDEMAAWGFHRPLIIPAEAIRTNDLAQRAANRELSARSRGFDTYVVENDGLSFWDGFRVVNYAVNTVARVNSDSAGGSQGAYLVHRVSLRRNASEGDTVNLSLLKKGLWKL